ncbi:MAG TPA: AI-2E family transporter [Pirellulales bacterium]|nr:AI-2E family transporter [Pirellulales bacterium]
MAPSDQFVKSALLLGAVAVVVAALYLAKGVLVPLTLAVLLSFLFSPLCNWLERRRLGRIWAVLVTAMLGSAVLGFAAWMAVIQMTALAPKMPEYQQNLQARLHAVNEYFVAALSKLTTTAEDVGEDLPQTEQADGPRGTDAHPYSVRVLSSPASPLQVLGGTFGTLLEWLGSAGIVIILVVFFLVRREDLRDRFIRLVGTGQVTVTTQMLADAATRVSRFLSVLFVLNATFGVAVGIGLYLLGVPNAILWGILAATLRFVPYIGQWIAAAPPICLAMAISPGWLMPLLTFGLFLVLGIFWGSVLEPWLYGKGTGVSAVAVLVAAVFWTWLWGIVGLLLATPLTVCLLVIGKHVPRLSFLHVLLGNEPVFEPTRRVYQRLLAGDQEEAAELFEDEIQSRPLVEVYDTLLIPALALAETDWHRGELDDGRHNFALQSLKEMIHDSGEGRQELHANDGIDNGNSPRPCILCLPARDEADEIAGMMLAQLLATGECLVQSVSYTVSAGELVDLVERRKPDVVCISATPPAAVMHARHLCNQVRGRFPDVPVVVGLWNAQGDLSKARTRIGGAETTHVVATLAEAQEQVRLLIEPLSRRSDGLALL